MRIHFDHFYLPKTKEQPGVLIAVLLVGRMRVSLHIGGGLRPVFRCKAHGKYMCLRLGYFGIERLTA